MAALTADRATVRFGRQTSDSPHRLGVKAATNIYAGALCVNDGGVAAPGRTAAGLVPLGVARKRYDNTGGAANAIVGEFDAGDHLFANAGDITAVNIGADCFIVDDQTVSLDATGKSRAGKIVDVNPPGFTGVSVRISAGL
jgi:hypothetical protein